MVSNVQYARVSNRVVSSLDTEVICLSRYPILIQILCARVQPRPTELGAQDAASAGAVGRTTRLESNHLAYV